MFGVLVCHASNHNVPGSASVVQNSQGSLDKSNILQWKLHSGLADVRLDFKISPPNWVSASHLVLLGLPFLCQNLHQSEPAKKKPSVRNSWIRVSGPTEASNVSPTSPCIMVKGFPKSWREQQARYFLHRACIRISVYRICYYNTLFIRLALVGASLF